MKKILTLCVLLLAVSLSAEQTVTIYKYGSFTEKETILDLVIEKTWWGKLNSSYTPNLDPNARYDITSTLIHPIYDNRVPVDKTALQLKANSDSVIYHIETTDGVVLYHGDGKLKPERAIWWQQQYGSDTLLYLDPSKGL